MQFWVKSLGDFVKLDFLKNGLHFFRENNFLRKPLPGSFYLLKINNRKTWSRNEIDTNLTIKRQEKIELRYSCVFIVKFE